MNAHLDDVVLDDALRSLDAADPQLTPAQQWRADALLASVVENSGQERPNPAEAVELRPRRRVKRWYLLAGAAASLAVGAMILPSGLGQNVAFASWTPVPGKVPTPVLMKASAACIDQLRRMGEPVQGRPAQDQSVVTGDISVRVAEQRGDYVLVAVESANNATATCLSTTADPGRDLGITGVLPTASAPATEPLGANAIRTGGPSLQSDGPNGFAVQLGEVGSAVKAVTIHDQGRTVQATVAGGRFAAWWPAGHWTTASAITYDVTLNDGKVLNNVDTGFFGKLPGPTEIGRVSRGAMVDASGPVSTVQGLVGAKVAGVVVHTGSHDVTATVSGDAFTASWPEAASTNSSELPPLSYDVVLKDGRVLPNVQAVS
jgi:hypothetical protein